MQQPRQPYSRRDLTLTESTGMLIDAATERGRREAHARNKAELTAAREELHELKHEVFVRRSELARQRRRVRLAIAFGVCALALAAGFGLGQWMWAA